MIDRDFEENIDGIKDAIDTYRGAHLGTGSAHFNPLVIATAEMAEAMLLLQFRDFIREVVFTILAENDKDAASIHPSEYLCLFAPSLMSKARNAAKKRGIDMEAMERAYEGDTNDPLSSGAS